MEKQQPVARDTIVPTASRQEKTSCDYSRRRFLQAGAAGAAALGALSQVRGDAPRLRGISREGLRTGWNPRSFDPDLVRLIDRITGGFSLAEYDYAEQMGYEDYLDEQLELTTEDYDPVLDAHLANFLMLDWSAIEIWNYYFPEGGENNSTLAMWESSSIQVIWMVYAKAQLLYRMFQFWSHHFNIDPRGDGHVRYLLFPFLRGHILPNALGAVPDLIRATAEGPAMLRYLNNDVSSGSAPNENYARELMELHTLGVDGGYDQEDIQQLAKILTGWTYCKNRSGCGGGLEWGQFLFDPNLHAPGGKTFLDHDIPEGGKDEGDTALNILVEHDSTADYISRKLCRFFLGGIDFNYNPPEDVVQMVKWTYLNSPTLGDIKAMLRIILSREVLSQFSVTKFRRPIDLVTAAMRATQAEVVPAPPNFLGGGGDNGLRANLESMGMWPTYWETPDGPYDTKAWMMGSPLPRWQYLDRLAEDVLYQFQDVDVRGLLHSVGALEPGYQAEGFNQILTGGRMTSREVEEVQEFVGLSVDEGSLEDALSLAMQMPTYSFHA